MFRCLCDGYGPTHKVRNQKTCNSRRCLRCIKKRGKFSGFVNNDAMQNRGLALELAGDGDEPVQ